MVVVAPEADLVAGLDPQLLTELFGDDDLTLGADTVSHTVKYDSTGFVNGARLDQRWCCRVRRLHVRPDAEASATGWTCVVPARRS